MKRVLTAILMLAIVIGVSYVSADRTRGRIQAQYDQGKTEGMAAVDQYRRQSDSLGELLSGERAEFAESLQVVMTEYESQSDSLEQKLTSAEKELEKARARKTAATTKPAARKVEASQVNPRHTQILAYYRQRLEQLPQDLSEYERKVALAEVREETSRKFAISLAELESLRKSNRLNE